MKAKQKMKKKLCVLIDSTGYSLGYAFRPYLRRQRYEYRLSKGWRPPKPRKHVKHAVLVDKHTHLILSQRTRTGPASDQPDFIPLLHLKSRFIRIRDVIADAGYDAEKHHQYVHRYFKAHCTIPPLQGRIGGESRMRTPFRQKMFERFPHKRYRQRAIVETCISVIKRRTGWTLTFRRWDLRLKEAQLKGIIYNIYRLLRLRIIK